MVQLTREEATDLVNMILLLISDIAEEGDCFLLERHHRLMTNCATILQRANGRPQEEDEYQPGEIN